MGRGLAANSPMIWQAKAKAARQTTTRRQLPIRPFRTAHRTDFFPLSQCLNIRDFIQQSCSTDRIRGHLARFVRNLSRHFHVPF